MGKWTNRTIFRSENERDWRLQQEYRARVRKEQSEADAALRKSQGER